MTWLLTLPRRLRLWLGIAAGVALAVVGAWLAGRRDGRTGAQADATRDTLRRVQRGQEAAARGQDGRTPDQRLRDNDGAWQ